MGKHAQLVIGAAGSGKSTYCYNMANHLTIARKRTVHVVNLDPAADHFLYSPSIDIRSLITVDKVMEELKLGPNGALMYALELLLGNAEWLVDAIGDYDEDYLIFDCPGQIELYSHQPLMHNFVRLLQQQLHYRVCVVYLIDAHFVTEPHKLMSGALSCLSAMMLLEATHVNVLSKVDLLEAGDRALLEDRLQLDTEALVGELQKSMPPKFAALNAAMSSILADYDLVGFLPLDPSDEDSISVIQQTIDNAIQFDDDVEPQTYDEYENENM